MEAVPRGLEVHFGDLQKEANTLCLPPATCAGVRGGDPQGSGRSQPLCPAISAPASGKQGACPVPSRAALHPPSYSLLNLLSWYQVNAPLLDSTQIPQCCGGPRLSSHLSPQRPLVMLKEIFTVTHITHSLCSPPVTPLLCFSQSHSRLPRLGIPRIYTRSLA